MNVFSTKKKEEKITSLKNYEAYWGSKYRLGIFSPQR
jgi:hypothetical protein